MDHGLTYAGARRGFGDRIAAAAGSCGLSWQIRRARRVSRIALRALGDALSGSAAVGRLVDEVRRHGHAGQHLETAIRASLEEDRADFGSVSIAARLAVGYNGMSDDEQHGRVKNDYDAFLSARAEVLARAAQRACEGKALELSELLNDAD